MRSGSRPLAEVDSNVSGHQRANPKHDGIEEGLADHDKHSARGPKRQKFGRPASIFADKVSKHTEESMDYETKDNSKLRTFLLDRDLSREGSRKELIERLQSSSINY